MLNKIHFVNVFYFCVMIYLIIYLVQGLICGFIQFWIYGIKPEYRTPEDVRMLIYFTLLWPLYAWSWFSVLIINFIFDILEKIKKWK